MVVRPDRVAAPCDPANKKHGLVLTLGEWWRKFHEVSSGTACDWMYDYLLHVIRWIKCDDAWDWILPEDYWKSWRTLDRCNSWAHCSRRRCALLNDFATAGDWEPWIRTSGTAKHSGMPSRSLPDAPFLHVAESQLLSGMIPRNFVNAN